MGMTRKGIVLSGLTLVLVGSISYVAISGQSSADSIAVLKPGGSSLSVQANYQPGETVKLSIINNSKTTLTYTECSPPILTIYQAAKIIYSSPTPKCVTIRGFTPQKLSLKAGESLSLTWDQLDTKGTQVANGLYSASVKFGGKQNFTTSFHIGKTSDMPTISRVSPASGTAGTKVTITGTGFTSDASVSLDWIFADEVKVENATTITFTVPSLAFAMEEPSYEPTMSPTPLPSPTSSNYWTPTPSPTPSSTANLFKPYKTHSSSPTPYPSPTSSATSPTPYPSATYYTISPTPYPSGNYGNTRTMSLIVHTAKGESDPTSFNYLLSEVQGL